MGAPIKGTYLKFALAGIIVKVYAMQDQALLQSPWKSVAKKMDYIADHSSRSKKFQCVVYDER